jgi:hypothetical protein
MKKAYKYLIAFLILSLILTLILISSKEVKFNRVILSKSNTVYNMTKKSYLDTIVKTALDIESVKGVTIVIQVLANLKQESLGGELEIKASIYGEGNTYILKMNDNIDKKEAVLVVAHEIIHLKQYYSKKLVIRQGYVFWGGVIVDHKNINYQERPWEKEAFSKQEELKNKIEKILLKL